MDIRPAVMKEFPPFRLDAVNECLWRRTPSGTDERILLSRPQYGLLQHLVERAGQLVTHQELLAAVWPRTAIEPQAVKTNISHLRRLLEDEPKRPRFIETLHRRGYRFVAAVAESPLEERATGPASARLVGRDAALAELWPCVRVARSGTLQIAFITGEPGIGKTALAQEFQRQLLASDRLVQVAHGQCVEGFGSKETFYPVLEAVGNLARGPDAARVVHVLATHAPTWFVQFPALLTREHRETLRQEILGATRERMLREGCEALETIAAPTPLVLVLEDLHWADYATLDLISALARRRVPARIMVIATYRPADVARPDQPLQALKRDLIARHLCREIALQPLTEPEIAQYLGAVQAGAKVPDQLVSLLHRHSEGNPLFLTAVLEHLAAHGLVQRDHAAWTLQRPATEIALQVPDSLRDMIGAQIDRLSESEQRVLEAGAIAGIPFLPVISAPSADMDIRSFEQCCETLARQGHIVRRSDTEQLPDGRVTQRYAFVHALYREVLYERQSPARRAALHRQRGETLEQVFASALDDVVPELARQFERAAEWSRAVKYLRRAAELAVRRYALAEARANLQHAFDLAGRLPHSERPAVETDILLSLGGLDVVTFDARDVETLTLLRQRAAHYGLVDIEAKTLVDLALPVARRDGKRALELLDDALRLSQAQRDPLLRAQTRSACMVRRISTGGWSEEDAAECEQGLAEIRRLGTTHDVARHVLDATFIGFYSSRYREAQRGALDSLALLLAERGERYYLSDAVSHWTRDAVVPWSLTFLGEWGAALRDLDAGIARAERNADSHVIQTLRLNRALVQLFAMDFAGARAICENALPELDPPALAAQRRYCLVIGGAAEAGLGNHERALEHLLTARAEAESRMVIFDWYRRLMVQWALTNLRLSQGDLDRAREEAEQFLAHAGATAERTWQALACEANARVALATGDLLRAEQLMGRALRAIEGVEAPVAGWQAHATAAEVARARADTAAATRHSEASRDIIVRLAASLEVDPALRQTFLSARAVARVLDQRTDVTDAAAAAQ